MWLKKLITEVLELKLVTLVSSEIKKDQNKLRNKKQKKQKHLHHVENNGINPNIANIASVMSKYQYKDV